jgi:hypothetical protein
MKVKLHTAARKNFTPEQWQQIHDAFEFFINKYKMSSYTLPVYVTFPNHINYTTEGQTLEDLSLSTKGLCTTKYKRYSTVPKPSYFIVKISSNNSMHKIFEAIFHEMTHVLQEMRGDFKYSVTGDYFYGNKYYSLDTVKRASYKEYRSFPWEQEARLVSKQLLDEWYAAGHSKRSFLQKLISLFGV